MLIASARRFLPLLVTCAVLALACTETAKETPTPETYADGPFLEGASPPTAGGTPAATATPARTATPREFSAPTPVSAADVWWSPADPALVAVDAVPADPHANEGDEPWSVFHVGGAATPRLVDEGTKRITEESLQWPSGQRLYFSTSGRPGGPEPSSLMAVDLDGRPPRPWKVAQNAELYPSPDGARQALVVRDQLKTWLYLRDTNGAWSRLGGLGSSVEMAIPSRRFPLPDRAGSTGWSPDGRGLMLYTNGADAPGGQFGALWYLPVGGGQATFVAASLVDDLTRMWWLPDGSRFVFVVADGEFLFDPAVGRSSCVTTGRTPPSCLDPAAYQLLGSLPTDRVPWTTDGRGFASEGTLVEAVTGMPLGTLPPRSGVYRRLSLSQRTRSVAETLEPNELDRPACILGDAITQLAAPYRLAPVARDQQTFLLSPVVKQPHILYGMVSAIDRFGIDAPPALTSTILYDRGAGRARQFDYCVNANGGVTATWLPDERHLELRIAADMWNYWSRVALLHAASGDVTNLTAGYELRARTIPSPDGSRVLVTGSKLRVYTAGGRLLREIAPPAGTYVAEAAWSPDGTGFAYVTGPVSEYLTLRELQERGL